MIDRFYIGLLNYADHVKETGTPEQLETVRTIIDMLQKAYDDGLRAREPVTNKKPRDAFEAFVLTIPDIQVFYDPTDHSYFYELDYFHFDDPREVMNHLIDFRTNKRGWCAAKAKGDILRYIAKKIEEVDAKKDCNKNSDNRYISIKERGTK